MIRPPKRPIDVSTLELLCIEWEDALQNMHFDGSADEAPTNTVILQNVGWLLNRTRTTITMISCRCPSDNTVRELINIPLRLVRAITTYIPSPREALHGPSA